MANAVKYTRTLFEPEHDLFRESYRAFLERHAAPFREEWEKAKIVDRYGPDARFELNKPLPAQLSAAARKATKAPAPKDASFKGAKPKRTK